MIKSTAIFIAYSSLLFTCLSSSSSAVVVAFSIPFSSPITRTAVTFPALSHHHHYDNNYQRYLATRALHLASSTTTTTTSSTSVLVASNSTETEGCNRELDDFLVQDLQKQLSETQSSTATVVHQQLQQQQQQQHAASEIQFARLLLIAAACLYGTNFSLVKLLGETDIPIGVSSTLRFGMAALATSPWLFQNIQPKHNNNNHNNNMQVDDSALVSTTTESSSSSASDVTMGVAFGAALAGFEVGVWNSIGYVSQAVGLQTTAASKSAFLCSLAVVIVPILDFIIGKKLQPRQIIGAVMALAGVAFLELGGMDSSDLLSLSSGDIASLFQPIAFGMGFWRMERAMQKYPDQANRSTAAQLLAVFAGSAMYCAIAEPGAMNVQSLQQYLTDPMILLSLFWTGVISTALTVYMETIALKSLSAAETTLILSTEPLWGAAFAALIMGETLGLDAAIGAVLILAGCIFSNLGIKGMQDFLRGNQSTQTQVALHEQGDAVSTTTGEASPANGTWYPFQNNVWRAGLALSLGAVFGNVWNDLSVGTKVLAFQLQELVEDITTFGPEP